MKLLKKIEKKDVIFFLITFIITIIIFIPFLKGHYATDTYNIVNIGYHDYAINWSLKDGRVFMAVIGLLAGKINMSIEMYVFITLFLALIISNSSVILLYKIIKKYKQPKNLINEVILIIISYITIFNFMYLENMYFVESIVMSISVFLFIIAANIIVEKQKDYFQKSLLLAIIAIICYQGTIGMFFTFTFLFTILKNKNNVKKILGDFCDCFFIAIISVVINILIVSLVGKILNLKQTRLGKISNIFYNIRQIIIKLPNIMRYTCNLFPKDALLLFLSVLTIIVGIYQLKNMEKKNIFYKYMAILIITIGSSCVIYIMTLTSFYTGRLRNSLGALVGILFLFIYSETDLFEKYNFLNFMTYCTFIIFVVLNIINNESLMLQHKVVNKLEMEEIKELDDYISKYEEENNIKVKKIVRIPVFNEKEKGFCPGVKNKTSFTHNALKTSWASDGIINFYTNRNMETIKITDEEIEKYKEISDGQEEYECIDDILYVKVYAY